MESTLPSSPLSRQVRKWSEGTESNARTRSGLCSEKMNCIRHHPSKWLTGTASFLSLFFGHQPFAKFRTGRGRRKGESLIRQDTGLLRVCARYCLLSTVFCRQMCSLRSLFFFCCHVLFSTLSLHRNYLQQTIFHHSNIEKRMRRAKLARSLTTSNNKIPIKMC